MQLFSIKKTPNFENVIKILKGEAINKVELMELLIDEEIKQVILEQYLNDYYYPPPIRHWGENYISTSNFQDRKEIYKNYYKQNIKFWYMLGYSLVPDLTFISYFESMNKLSNKTIDKAELSKGTRFWATEKVGMIKDWEDFKNFPWDKATCLIEEYIEILEIIKNIIPEGMKIGVVGTLFEEPLEWILGYENFFFMLKDNIELVKEIFNKVGTIIFKFYESVISHDVVGCIFHADDLGYKTGTMISPNDLKELVFPWFKKYAEIAHRNKKPFFLHSCGKKDEIMDILIEDVNIDAIHSFEDSSYSVKKYKEIWGNKVGIIGGVDIDKLTRFDETDLKIYLRDILDTCMRGGRYIFGSGNSIANYVPIKNYLTMIEIAEEWNKISR